MLQSPSVMTRFTLITHLSNTASRQTNIITGVFFLFFLLKLRIMSVTENIMSFCNNHSVSLSKLLSGCRHLQVTVGKEAEMFLSGTEGNVDFCWFSIYFFYFFIFNLCKHQFTRSIMLWAISRSVMSAAARIKRKKISVITDNLSL